MKVSDRIGQYIREALHPEHVELINESHMHAGPALDSHFKLVVVSSDFRQMSRVKRHQHIYRLLQDELISSGKGGQVHALALHLFTPEEWEKVPVPDSPLCAGSKSK